MNRCALASPSHDHRAPPARCSGASSATIYDQSTWHVNRLMFDGTPVVEGKGLTVIPADVHMADGPRLDFAAAAPPHCLQERQASTSRSPRSSAAAVKVERDHARRPRRAAAWSAGTTYVIADLSMDLAVEAEAGPTTVGAFYASDATTCGPSRRTATAPAGPRTWAAQGRLAVPVRHRHEREARPRATRRSSPPRRRARPAAGRGRGRPAFCSPRRASRPRCLKASATWRLHRAQGHLRTFKVLSDWNPAVTAAAAAWPPGAGRRRPAGVGHRVVPRLAACARAARTARSCAATARSSSPW